MPKQNKGITLISLVIIIIILLILAGISISALTRNGLLEKAKLAKQKATEVEIKEKIELLLNEYQIEKTKNENLNLYDYFSHKKESEEIDILKDNEDGTIKIELKGYSFTIDVEKTIIISNKIKVTSLIPVMNKNISNDGSVEIRSNDLFGSEIFYGCDGNDETWWSTGNGNYDPKWYEVKFSSPKIVSAYSLRGGLIIGKGSPVILYEFYIEASNDGNNWTKLEGDIVHTGVHNSADAPDVSMIPYYYIDLENNTPYKYYRIYFSKGGWTWGSTGGVAIAELQLFGF